MTDEATGIRQQGRKAKGEQRQIQRETPSPCLGLEWTESEWFQIWLQLAREGQRDAVDQR